MVALGVAAAAQWVEAKVTRRAGFYPGEVVRWEPTARWHWDPDRGVVLWFSSPRGFLNAANADVTYLGPVTVVREHCYDSPGRALVFRTAARITDANAPILRAWEAAWVAEEDPVPEGLPDPPDAPH